MTLGLFQLSTFPCKTTERRRGKLRQTENGSSFQGVKGKELPVKFTVGAQFGKKQAGKFSFVAEFITLAEKHLTS